MCYYVNVIQNIRMLCYLFSQKRGDCLIIFKEKRIEKHITQDQVALACGVDRTTVTKWETGKSTPSVENLKKLSVIFGCTIDELVKGEQ